ncbi:MAG: acetyltransferase [Clostridia bacterium]|nr:acetyltransferase [Clostridia bacterium]
MENLLIIGAGGYSKSVLDSVDIYNFNMCGFIDEFSDKSEHLGYPIIATKLEEIPDYKSYVYFIAIGNNVRRKRWYDKLTQLGLRLVNIIDRSAIISPRARIGNGCFVGKLAIINACATLGDNCVVNTRALLEHGSVVGNHVNVSTNVSINGDVRVMDGCFVGSSSVIIGQLTIGAWSTIGAGAVVIRDVESGITVAGVPAKKIKDGAMLG